MATKRIKEEKAALAKVQKMMAAGAGSRSFADASRGLRAHADAERQRLAARTVTAAAPPGLTAAKVPARSER